MLKELLKSEALPSYTNFTPAICDVVREDTDDLPALTQDLTNLMPVIAIAILLLMAEHATEPEKTG